MASPRVAIAMCETIYECAQSGGDGGWTFAFAIRERRDLRELEASRAHTAHRAQSTDNDSVVNAHSTEPKAYVFKDTHSSIV